jgi:hypothetical protein
LCQTHLVGIGDWFRKRSARRDQEAVQRAEETAYETDAERRAENIESKQADTMAARSTHEGSIDDANRLSDL